MTNISIVIPVLGNYEYTDKCLRSINEKSRLIDEIIVIDNETPPKTAELLMETWGADGLVSLNRNLGVAASWDIGIRLAKNNIVCVCNNDVEMVVDGWDEMLIEQWKEYSDAAIMCPWPCDTTHQTFNTSGDPIKGLNGSCFFVKKDILQLTDNYKLKGEYIDNNFKQAYWEDADLLVQIRKAGFESYVTPRVKTVHYSNQTAGNILPRDKCMENPYWSNLEYFNKKYNVHIWDYFKVYMSNVLHETTNVRLI